MFKKIQRNDKGFALIAVIWTLALLSLFVMSFTLDAFLEGKISTFLRARHQASALIDSGLVIADMLMERSGKVSGEETEEDLSKDRWIAPATRLSRGQQVELHQRLRIDEQGSWQFDTSNVEKTSDEQTAEAEIIITIEPEPARWNINKLTKATFGENADEIWAAILTQAGVPEEDQAEMVDSFYDWVDSDSVTVSADGAEDDYYENETPPYKAKNGALDTVGELSYIRGFKRNNAVILKGGIWNPDDPKERQITVSGIEDLFTTYGDGKLNVNAASRKVLLTVPPLVDADGLIVDTILEEREGLNQETGSNTVRNAGRSAGLSGAAIEDYHFKDIGDLTGRVPGIVQSEISAYLSVDTGIYKVSIEGKIGSIRRKINAIVQRIDASSAKTAITSSTLPATLSILQWQEEI